MREREESEGRAWLVAGGTLVLAAVVVSSALLVVAAERPIVSGAAIVSIGLGIASGVLAWAARSSSRHRSGHVGDVRSYLSELAHVADGLAREAPSLSAVQLEVARIKVEADLRAIDDVIDQLGGWREAGRTDEDREALVVGRSRLRAALEQIARMSEGAGEVDLERPTDEAPRHLDS